MIKDDEKSGDLFDGMAWAPPGPVKNETKRSETSGQQAARAGIESIGNKNAGWMNQALDEFRVWARGQGEFSMEDFRQWWQANDKEPPSHHNAWGAFGRMVVREDLVEPVGYRQARSKATHAHPVRVYRPV